MIVFETKLKGTDGQYRALDEALRTARFVRNSCLRYWMENKGVGRYDLNKYCKILADNIDFPWVKKLNSMARQSMAERAWSGIARFFDNCKKNTPGKKGFPKFKKHQTHASVEYKTSGWKLSEDRREITFTDGFEAGTFKMWGTRDLHFYQIEQIKRVRVVRRADGYYAQFCIDQERSENHELTGKNIGIDVGLNHFLTDSEGLQVENPRFLRRDEKALKKVQRRLSRTSIGSQNRIKARNRLGRKHLKVQRRRKDFAVKTRSVCGGSFPRRTSAARCVIQSSDLVAIEDLKVRNMGGVSGGEASPPEPPLRNHHLAKSISDAAWSQFREWLEYFGKIFGVPVIAVPPHYTSQNCSNCGGVVKKTLSTRTHKCHHCGHTQDRDHNAAINILKLALRQLSKTTEGHSESQNVSGENDKEERQWMLPPATLRLCTVQETNQCKPTRRKRKPK